MRLHLILAAVFWTAMLAVAHAAPTGLWLTEDRTGVIEIAPCGAALCGRIVGMAAPRDARNCGLVILPDAKPNRDGGYDGHVTDPSTGSVWRCVLWLDETGDLNLHGYVLLPWLGRTQKWTRYTGRVNDRCEIVL